MEVDMKLVGMLVLVALVTAACGGGSGGKTPTGITGQISGDGSSTVFPITEAVAEEFRRANPGVNITVGVAGTGGGFKKFCAGETDLQNASRLIKEKADPGKQSEKETCAAKGIKYVELAVANDGLAVVTHKSNNFVDCLTTAELKKIWEPGSKVSKWKDVRAGFPSQPIKLFGPGTDSGTFDYFTKEINGEEGASRTDFTPSEDDNVLVQGVSGDAGSLGYFGFAYYAENTDKLKVLGVDGGNGCVVPSDETVKSNAYAPLSRPLFLYVSQAAISRPEVKAFVDFYLANVPSLLADVGYTPLSEATLAAETAEWQTASGG